MRYLVGIEKIFVRCCILGKQKVLASGARGAAAAGGGVSGTVLV